MTMQEVFTVDPQNRTFERLRSQWNDSYNIWLNLPLSLVLDIAPNRSASSTDRGSSELAPIGYTVCSKDHRALMCIELTSEETGAGLEEKLSLLTGAGLPDYVVSIEQRADYGQGYNRFIVDYIIAQTLAHVDAGNEFDEYIHQQQLHVDHVAGELPGEGSSPYLNDWYAGEDVDPEEKYNPIVHERRKLQREFSEWDRRGCSWGAGDLACSAKAQLPSNRPEQLFSSPSGLGKVVGRRARIQTHVGDVESGSVWVTEFDRADLVASNLASLLATKRALALIIDSRSRS